MHSQTLDYLSVNLSNRYIGHTIVSRFTKYLLGEFKQTNMHRVAVKKHDYICNVEKRTNYMFRPFMVRPSSGWIQLSDEPYYNTIFYYHITIKYCIAVCFL